jgi:hypothetical protein
MVVDLKANEMVIKATDSCHLTDEDTVNGKFIVTNQRIYFISKNNDHNCYNREIMPDEIKEVIYIKGQKLFSKGLNLVTKEGDNYKFVMKKRSDFGKLINSMY